MNIYSSVSMSISEKISAKNYSGVLIDTEILKY